MQLMSGKKTAMLPCNRKCWHQHWQSRALTNSPTRLGVPLPTVLCIGPACSQLPDCRAEKIAAKLPRKDINAVRKRVALLEVRVPLT